MTDEELRLEVLRLAVTQSSAESVVVLAGKMFAFVRGAPVVARTKHHHREWTFANAEDAHRRLAAGRSLRDVARDFSVSKPTICNLLKKFSLSPPRDPSDPGVQRTARARAARAAKRAARTSASA